MMRWRNTATLLVLLASLTVLGMRYGQARVFRMELHGSADDFNPIAACRSYIQSLQAAGHDVRLIEYPGAHHAFDWPLLQDPLTLDEAITTRACRLAEGSDGHVINLETGQPFGYDDPCVEYGPTVAHDAAAHNAARRAVNELLIEVFGLDS